MNQRQLSYFLEVYKQCNITAAAQTLFITPQALSKTILSLEEELDTTLFLRSGKKLVPTKAAINLTSHAKNILEEYRFIQDKSFISHKTRKKLTILVSYDTLQYFPVQFFHDFHELYPEILLSLSEMPDKDILEQIDQNNSELAFIPGPLDGHRYDMMHLFTNHFCLIINKKNPLSEKERISFEDLEHQSLVIKNLFSPISGSQLNQFMSHNVEPLVTLEVSDYNIIHQMAEENFAVGMTLDYLTLSGLSDNVVVRPFASKTMIKSTYLIYRQGIVLSNEANYFKDFMHNWIRGHKDLFHLHEKHFLGE